MTFARRHGPSTLLLSIGALLTAVPLCGAAGDYEGRKIVAIRFDPEKQPLPMPEIRKLMTLEAGQPLRIANVRAMIEKLFASGRYEDIVVDVTPQAEGVVLRFLTAPTYFVGIIAVDPVAEPPNQGQLVNATKIELGSALTAGMIRQAVEGIQESLRANGYYEAEVTSEVAHDDEVQQASLVFHVKPGPRARFTTPVIQGTPGKADADVIRSTRWKRFFGMGWRKVTEQAVNSGMERVRQSYQRSDHLLATVGLQEMAYDEDTDRATPHIEIDAGPVVRITSSGNRIPRSKLKQLVPVYQERAVDRDLVAEGRRNIVEFLQAQGYFEADVDFDREPAGTGEERIEYRIDRGARHKLAHLEIRGNRYFNLATLRERMYIVPAAALRYRYGRYSEEYLRRDINAIKDLYRSNGFRDIEVSSLVEDNYGGKKEQLSVTLTVAEGAQYKVKTLDLTGVEEADREYLTSLLRSQPGQPFSELSLATDQDTVLNFYYNNGYPGAKFDSSAKAAATPHEFDIRMSVIPGERRYVRRVVVSGAQRTSLALIRERISVHEGDPLSQSRITDSQRRLYDLGVFARVDTGIQNPDGEEQNKYVLYRLEEAKKYSFNVGFGAEVARIGGGNTSNLAVPQGQAGFSPRASIGVSRSNFLGLGHTLSLQTRISTIDRRALATYLAPQFVGSSNLSLSLSSLYEDTRGVNTFSARRFEASTQLSERLSKANTAQYRLTFRRVAATDIKITQGLVPLLSQTVRVGLLGGTFIQDRRDDPTDSRKGVYNSIDGSVALKALLSQTNFARVFARNTTYHRIGRDLVVARTLSFGWIHSLSGCTPVAAIEAGANSCEFGGIPVPERFFSGGANTQRGFPENQAGPRDLITGFPVGGNALLMNNLELRFPVTDNIGGVLFHDAGNVYSALDKISLRFHQKNEQDFNYMVQAVGFGIRYRTPIGPIRVDAGYAINSPRFRGCQGSVNDLLFNCGPGSSLITDQRLSRFQFHFSLGQTF